MEPLLSWCCLLIDIKTHWPLCHFSSSRCLSAFTPPSPTPSVLDGCGLSPCDRTFKSRLSHSLDVRNSPPPFFLFFSAPTPLLGEKKTVLLLRWKVQRSHRCSGAFRCYDGRRWRLMPLRSRVHGFEAESRVLSRRTLGGDGGCAVTFTSSMVGLEALLEPLSELRTHGLRL